MTYHQVVSYPAGRASTNSPKAETPKTLKRWIYNCIRTYTCSLMVPSRIARMVAGCKTSLRRSLWKTSTKEGMAIRFLLWLECLRWISWEWRTLSKIDRKWVVCDDGCIYYVWPMVESRHKVNWTLIEDHERRFTKVNMTLIYIIIGLCAIAAVAGFFLSKRTRKLVIFALLVLLGGALIYGGLIVIRLLFPPPPLWVDSANRPCRDTLFQMDRILDNHRMVKICSPWVWHWFPSNHAVFCTFLFVGRLSLPGGLWKSPLDHDQRVGGLRYDLCHRGRNCRLIGRGTSEGLDEEAWAVTGVLVNSPALV